ncbi:hypothetical protein L1987_64095 [Smallanthus sonchifolius]|uniref:Uncharacterized protein n=1 Tax=Smallanthus sonchifolius TaxID=185202 RepID=A0ACB9CF26_9ASTR|nr:hypothetical protein L1987_64095 [Smallanthus sonchifolius]
MDERGRSFHCVTWTLPPAIHHRPRRSFHTGRTTTTVVRPDRRHRPIHIRPCAFKRWLRSGEECFDQILRVWISPQIMEEPPKDAERGRTFKFLFIACEIFTCEVDIILKALVEDDELMNMLLSFLEPEHPHSTLLAGYFSKDCPEVHGNAAKALSAITRYAPPGLDTKISSLVL